MYDYLFRPLMSILSAFFWVYDMILGCFGVSSRLEVDDLAKMFEGKTIKVTEIYKGGHQYCAIGKCTEVYWSGWIAGVRHYAFTLASEKGGEKQFGIMDPKISVGSIEGTSNHDGAFVVISLT